MRPSKTLSDLFSHRIMCYDITSNLLQLKHNFLISASNWKFKHFIFKFTVGTQPGYLISDIPNWEKQFKFSQFLSCLKGCLPETPQCSSPQASPGCRLDWSAGDLWPQWGGSAEAERSRVCPRLPEAGGYHWRYRELSRRRSRFVWRNKISNISSSIKTFQGGIFSLINSDEGWNSMLSSKF